MQQIGDQKTWYLKLGLPKKIVKCMIRQEDTARIYNENVDYSGRKWRVWGRIRMII